jgi:DNA-binding beta-propeller fold protein YncE
MHLAKQNPPARKSALLASLALLLTAPFSIHATELLEPGKPIVFPEAHGKFDFLVIDADGRRLLAANTGNGSLDVLDLDKQEIVKVVATGAAQSSAVDAQGHRYLVSVSKPPQLVIVDSSTLEATGKVPLPGPADLVAINSATGKAYVDHDDGKEAWVVDVAAQKLVGTVELPSDSPEDLFFDEPHQRLFQAMKTGSIIAVVDVATGKVAATWPTAPVQGPHGMAAVPELEAFLAVGGNGKLVLMSQKDGRVLSSCDVTARVDEIAYDPEVHRVYCASGTGRIAVVELKDEKLTALGEVASSQGCHSIAVDPKTHTVWIAYAKGDSSILQPFAAPK